MMASGKSTIGNLVSKKLIKFYDIDKIIEKETNMTISQIFAEKSEIFLDLWKKKQFLKFLKIKKCNIPGWRCILK